MNLGTVFQQIALIVFLPMALGYATQRILVSRYGQKVFAERFAPRFPALSTLGVLGIVFIALALKAKTITGAPQMLVQILVPLAIVYGINYALSTVLGRMLLPRGDAIAMVYGTVMRNLSIALAVAINAFGAKARMLPWWWLWPISFRSSPRPGMSSSPPYLWSGSGGKTRCSGSACRE